MAPVQILGLPRWLSGKESPCQAGDAGWQDSLEKEMATHSGILAWKNPMDRGACPQWATVRGVIKSWT